MNKTLAFFATNPHRFALIESFLSPEHLRKIVEHNVFLRNREMLRTALSSKRFTGWSDEQTYYFFSKLYHDYYSAHCLHKTDVLPQCLKLLVPFFTLKQQDFLFEEAAAFAHWDLLKILAPLVHNEHHVRFVFRRSDADSQKAVECLAPYYDLNLLVALAVESDHVETVRRFLPRCVGKEVRARIAQNVPNAAWDLVETQIAQEERLALRDSVDCFPENRAARRKI